MMNKEHIQAIKARCEAATPGPWTEYDGFVFSQSVPKSEYNFTQGKVVAGCSYNTTGKSPNAVFTAHARQDIPALLAYIEELKAELEKAA